MRSLLLPLLPLLVFGCSQNPHVNVTSQPVRSNGNAQRTVTEPTPAPQPEPTPVPVDPLPTGDADRDGDGVPDAYDVCPDVPGPVYHDGCPLDHSALPDRDGDGVPDLYDVCPDVPGPVFHDGCPLEGPKPQIPPPETGYTCQYPTAPEEEHRVLLEVKDSLKFDFDKAIIKPQSFPSLRHLVAFMERYPLAHLYMVGHTDDVGTDRYNMWLSAARVYAVKDFLVRNGIAPYRITVDARGKREPLVNTFGMFGDELDRARAMNRRVDFDVRYMSVE